MLIELSADRGDAWAIPPHRPLVTISVPTIGGRPSLLAEALESLHQQTYPHLEILLLDDASSGEGQQTLQRFVDRDPRARILRSEQRGPMFANFNRGICAARGDYVVICHDDDVYLPEFIERELGLLERHPQAGFAGSNYFLIDQTGNVTGFPGLVPQTQVMRGRDYIQKQLSSMSMIIGTPGIMFRRNLLAAFPFDESLSVHGGDLIMRFHMAEVADVALLAEPLLKIRVHPRSETSSVASTERIVLRASLLRDYIADYAQRWPDDRAFARSLQRDLVRSHLAVLLWDWIALGDDAEAEQRRVGLAAIPPGAWLARALAVLERLGLSARRRRAILAPLLRRLGRGIRSPYEQPIR
jgi:glycosyltransferase involved in cell wall biosynthesis